MADAKLDPKAIPEEERKAQPDDSETVVGLTGRPERRPARERMQKRVLESRARRGLVLREEPAKKTAAKKSAAKKTAAKKTAAKKTAAKKTAKKA